MKTFFLDRISRTWTPRATFYAASHPRSDCAGSFFLLDAAIFRLHCNRLNAWNDRSLTDLSLTANNLASLPEELGDLAQLVVLRVDDNQLECLPESIGRLAMLEELEVPP